jgi:dTDP-4-dehydrorhamnose reductase
MKITKETRIYVAGCGGMLGEAVYHTLKDLCQVKATDIDVNEPWLQHADIRDRAQIEKSILDFRPPSSRRVS